MDFSTRLKELRDRKKITQAQLAKDLGVGLATVGMWESSKRKPPADTLIEIADYFDVFGGYIYPYHHLEKVFDGYLSSSEIGCLKADTLPDGTRPFFKKFMADNALNPQDCILIDNDLISDSFYREQGFEVYSPQTPNDVLQTLLKL